jgi:hypothetical protein
MKKATETGGKWRSGSDHPASGPRTERHARPAGHCRPVAEEGRPAITATTARSPRGAPGHAPGGGTSPPPTATRRRARHGERPGTTPPTCRGRTFRGESQENPGGPAHRIPARENASGHATTPAGGESGGRPPQSDSGGEEPDRVARSRTIRDFSMVYPRAISSKPTRGLLGRMEGAYAHPRG